MVNMKSFVWTSLGFLGFIDWASGFTSAWGFVESGKNFRPGRAKKPHASTTGPPRHLSANEVVEGFAELSAAAPVSLEDRVCEVFALIDTDGSGSLCENELGQLLEKVHHSRLL